MQDPAGAPHGQESVYPGLCRDPAHRVPGRPAALRWRVPHRRVCVRDGWSGEVLCQELGREAGDFVLRRGDGAYAYHLAVVVDDAEMGVTDVLRGADLLSSAPRQRALQDALGYPHPRYWHAPLLTDFQGERLSKRGGAPSVQALREGGADPARLRSELLASLGWAVPGRLTVEGALEVYRRELTPRLSLVEDGA